MNIRFNFRQHVCLFFILCQISGVYAQPPVYKVTKSVAEDITDPTLPHIESKLRLQLLNEKSDVAGVISSRDTTINRNFSNAVRWRAEDILPTQLGSPPLSSSDGYATYKIMAINDKGIIVGQEESYGRILDQDFISLLSTKAVFWSADSTIPTVLGSLSDRAEAVAINNSDIIAGSSRFEENGISKGTRSVRWSPGNTEPVNLGVLSVNSTGEGESSAIAINDSGIIVGKSVVYEDDTPMERAVRWGPNDTNPINLGILDGHSESVAIGINSNGVIIGRSGTFAVRWDPDDTRPIMLGALSPDIGVYSGNGPYYRSISNAHVINNNNVIAGNSHLYDRSIAGGPPRFRFARRGNPAVRWDAFDTVPTDLSVLGTTSATPYFSLLDSHPNDINDSDTIVGNSGYGRPYHPENNSSDETKAVLWDKNGDLYDLNLLLASFQQSEWVLNNAISINNSGVILAKGTFNGASYYAVLEPQGPSTVESANRPVVDFPCNIGADPQTIRAGEKVPLWWWSDEEENGFFPIINNGIGILDSSEGYKWVSPTETTTYKMSARRKGNKIATCETTIVVEDEEKPTSPLCYMGADPQTIRAGERIPLWWWAEGSTIYPSIDNGIGQVGSFAGYKWVYPSETTTYTMAVESEQGATATCETTIVVDGKAKPAPPLCDIGADPQTIVTGDRVPLWWWFEEDFVTTAKIDNGVGSISDAEGYEWIEPNETTTYTLTVENEIGTQGICETTIIVNKK